MRVENRVKLKATILSKLGRGVGLDQVLFRLFEKLEVKQLMYRKLSYVCFH